MNDDPRTDWTSPAFDRRDRANDWMRGGLPHDHPLAFLSAWCFARHVDTNTFEYKDAHYRALGEHPPCP